MYPGNLQVNKVIGQLSGELVDRSLLVNLVPGDSLTVRDADGSLLGHLKYFGPEEAEHVMALDEITAKRLNEAIQFRFQRIEEEHRG